MTARRLIWIAIPLGILGIVAGIIIALPGLVASSAHRATIEALASSITGRRVHIAGNLSLSLFPQPQLIAGNVTIDAASDAASGEMIKARSLTLDIAMPALLHGQLTASSLVLQSPVIAFPWPLPGGPDAVAPPPWLTTLHAQINNGRITLGGVTIHDVTADVFTGGNGTLSISGTAKLAGHDIAMTFSLGQIDQTGRAPLAAEFQSGAILAHFTGSFSTSNLITGTIAASQTGQAWLTGDVASKLTLSATLTADPAHAALTSVSLVQGPAQLAGTAQLDFANHHLTASLSGSDLALASNALGSYTDFYQAAPADFTIHDHLIVDRLELGGVTIPHLDETSDLSAQGLHLTDGSAALGDAGDASFTGTIDPAGNIAAQAHMKADLQQLLTNTQGAPQPVDITATINGTQEHLNIANIKGTLDGARVAGSAIVTADNAVNVNSNWTAAQIDLLSLAGFLHKLTNRGGLTGHFELASDHANISNILLSHVLIDGGFGKNLTIQRMSASLYDGLLAGNLTMQSDGTIAAAHGFLSLPSAAPLAGMIPAWLTIPGPSLNAPLAISLTAAGSPTALATNAAATFGQFTVATSPVINLSTGSAAGAFTLRHPSAIAVFKLFGLNAGLTWPGAGSLSIRSDFNLSHDSFGLPNFVLSMGDLTAAGNITAANGNNINGTLNADVLALPMLPSDLSAFWKSLPSLNGKIIMTANQVLVAGTPWLSALSGVIDMQPGKAMLDINRAAFSGGDVKGTLSLTEILPQPPAITANITISKADLSQINLPFKFPVTIPSGTAGLTLQANATGFTPQTWLATLSGPVNLQAQLGTLYGFSLAALATALQPLNQTAIKAALAKGTTEFSSASIGGNFDHGILKISNARLQGPAGAATATGSIDLSDNDLALNFGLHPNAMPSANIGLAIIGGWVNPRRIVAAKAAQAP